MSKVIPKPYYVCDYCGKKSDYPRRFKYTDNSGLDDQCYDMCSDKCLENHIDYLRELYYRKLKYLNFDFDGTVEDHCKDFIWGYEKYKNEESNNKRVELYDFINEGFSKDDKEYRIELHDLRNRIEKALEQNNKNDFMKYAKKYNGMVLEI